MPLPDTDQLWPPAAERRAAPGYTEHRAWYAGDTTTLAKINAGSGTPGAYGQPQARRRGAAATIRRFWSGPTDQQGTTPPKLHLPLAADVASTSADFLYGDRAEITANDPGQQDRLDELLADGVRPQLLESAETASALGGVYLVATYNRDVASGAFLTAYDPATAVPTFTSGRLTAVTFWRVVDDRNGQVLRHLERHEPGQVWHGLYRGEPGSLGRAVPLTEHPDTAPYADHLDPVTGAVPMVAGALTAVYHPNVLPNRLTPGSPLGRSDYQGSEPLMDALDETWSSWMRDLRIGKGRLIVPDSYMTNLGAGHGASFDAEREVWSGVNAMVDPTKGMTLQAEQFNIRVDEHERTAQALTNAIVRGAGWSAAAFGDNPDTMAVTATQVASRDRRSRSTRDRKIEYCTPPAQRILGVLTMLDAAVFPEQGGTGTTVKLDFPEADALDPEALARSLQLLDAAGAISTELKVRRANPEMSETEYDVEVARVRAEKGVPGVGGQDPEAILRAAAGQLDQLVPMPPAG